MGSYSSYRKPAMGDIFIQNFSLIPHPYQKLWARYFLGHPVKSRFLDILEARFLNENAIGFKNRLYHSKDLRKENIFKKNSKIFHFILAVF